MERTIKQDVCEWDVENWSRAIDIFEKVDLSINNSGKINVLDIGGRNGGLTLYWALKGANVVCSEIDEKNFDKAKELHRKYGVKDSIKYEVVNATDIKYDNYFDIITWKSVMGGVGYDNNYKNQKIMMEQCYKALKPGGMLMFVENLTGSKMHMFLRRKLRRWGNRWRYVQLGEFEDLLDMYTIQYIETFGFLGILGRKRILNILLSGIDKIFDRFIRKNNRYIVSIVAMKEGN